MGAGESILEELQGGSVRQDGAPRITSSSPLQGRRSEASVPLRKRLSKFRQNKPRPGSLSRSGGSPADSPVASDAEDDQRPRSGSRGMVSRFSRTILRKYISKSTIPSTPQSSSASTFMPVESSTVFLLEGASGRKNMVLYSECQRPTATGNVVFFPGDVQVSINFILFSSHHTTTEGLHYGLHVHVGGET